MIKVTWSNDLAKLADRLATNLSAETDVNPADVLARRQCVVVPSALMHYWFLHQCMYGKTDELRVAADIDFPLLHAFVNDWLFRMTEPSAHRDPAQHPFAMGSILWRVYQLLGNNTLSQPVFAPLASYLDSGGKSSRWHARGRYVLAMQVAQLLDTYQVYRPTLLKDWERGQNTQAEEPSLAWQPELWRLLTANGLEIKTYLNDFLRMEKELAHCGINDTYRAVHVFGVSMMPRTYAVFFHLLSQIIDTHFYLFNPCKEEWSEALSDRENEKTRSTLRLEGFDDDLTLLECDNPFLAHMGHGCRDFLGEVIDLTDGQASSAFSELGSDTLLKRLQLAVLSNDPTPRREGTSESDADEPDGSIEIHICHSPMRELEVLKDHLLDWFKRNSELQPRDIQVQVSDMALYGPYIDAVFATIARNAPATIPYVVADRASTGESVIAEAFNTILKISEGRFAAPEVLDLLHCENVRCAFGLSDTDLDALKSLIQGSGVRWGRDQKHRRDELGVAMTEQTTWRHGLDRLFLGYAYTEHTDMAEDLPLPADRAEGDEARVLGRLARFVDELQYVADYAKETHSPEDWVKHIQEMIATFFATTNETYREVGALNAAAENFRKSTFAGELQEALPINVVRDFVSGQLKAPSQGEELGANAVLFSALRSGSSTNRRIVCLLGLGDGQFPRSDNRSSYDLLRTHHQRGDQSVRIEDRMAFLEAFMSAGERLYISYVGHTIDKNEEIPPSMLLEELREYAESIAGKEAVASREHKLHGFDAAYFKKGQELFSYSRSSLRTARAAEQGVTESTQPQPKIDLNGPLPEGVVKLEDLVSFFQNPAKYYYTKILRLHLEEYDRDELADTEQFSPRGLDEYEIDRATVEGLLADKDRDAVYRELAEQGTVPLMEWGHRWFCERWKDTDGLLNSALDGGRKIIDLLQEVAPLDNSILELQFDNGHTTLTGNPKAIRNADGTILSIDFRLVKPKAKDPLASMIRNLFSCACALSETRYCVTRKENDFKPKKDSFGPTPTATARQQMAKLLRLYAAGRLAVLPFAPEAAKTYVQAFQKAMKKEDAEETACRTEARTTATTRWQKKEAKDRYLKAVFHEDGPVNRPGFHEIAMLVYTMPSTEKKGSHND